MSIEPVRRRRDRTPCLLFPELYERGGGLARAIQERASLYARHYEHVVLLTTGYSPRIEEVVASLKERGSLDERVVVRNFFLHSSWVRGLGAPAAAARALPGQPDVISKRQRMPGGAFFRIADRHPEDRHPYGYRYFDADGRLLVSTLTSPGSKHEQRATVHAPQPRQLNWGTIVADWVDEELAELHRPVLFSLQRGFNDPVLLASTRPVRKVASLHNCHYTDPEDPASGIRPVFRPLLASRRSVDEIVCLTEQQRRELEQDAPDARFRAIPYPGRPPRRPAPDKDLSLVVLVAQLIDRKRVDHAIRAFSLVTRTHPAARLEIYGEGPAEAQLRGLVEELGLEGSVSLMGYSLEVDRAQARAACTLMTSTFEGFARVISESMSLGTPVIAYDVRYGPRDLIRHEIDGLLVTEQEPAALATAVGRLLSDPREAVEMGVRASEVLERFPIEPFEQAWLDVVARRPSPSELLASVLRRSDVARRLRRRFRTAVASAPARPQPVPVVRPVVPELATSEL